MANDGICHKICDICILNILMRHTRTYLILVSELVNTLILNTSKFANNNAMNIEIYAPRKHGTILKMKMKQSWCFFYQCNK